MNSLLNQDLDIKFAEHVIKNVSTGIALFHPDDFCMRWCNSSFKKQTWFGGAGRTATKVNIKDLFEPQDHKLIHALFDIAMDLGQAYDFQRQIRRGPAGSFPAEIKLHKIIIDKDEVLVCLEILDLSLTKLHEDLQNAHAQLQEKMADLMAAQAELHYSIRMNTVSELGGDIAHQLINPIMMCQGILQQQILPSLTQPDIQKQMNHALKYIQNIQDLAVWFRKFSNPKIHETQIVQVEEMIDDALTLNAHRLAAKNIAYHIIKDPQYNPCTIVNPINFIIWLNAAFHEFLNATSSTESQLNIKILGDDKTVKISIQYKAFCTENQKIETINILEKFATKMQSGAKFNFHHDGTDIFLNLILESFHMDAEEPTQNMKMTSEKSSAQELHTKKKPTILIVDDEIDIRRLIARVLKQKGWNIVEAEDGIAALDYFKNEDDINKVTPISVIVSDVRMPRMTGPHLLVALREAKIQTPFIFFSSNLVQKENDGFKYENVSYLTKEAGLEELKKIIQNFLYEEENSLIPAA